MKSQEEKIKIVGKIQFLEIFLFENDSLKVKWEFYKAIFENDNTFLSNLNYNKKGNKKSRLSSKFDDLNISF